MVAKGKGKCLEAPKSGIFALKWHINLICQENIIHFFMDYTRSSPCNDGFNISFKWDMFLFENVFWIVCINFALFPKLFDVEILGKCLILSCQSQVMSFSVHGTFHLDKKKKNNNNKCVLSWCCPAKNKVLWQDYFGTSISQ